MTTLSTPNVWPPLAADTRLEQHLCVAGMLLLAVSPLASFALCGFLLMTLHARTPREVRWVLEISLALALSMMTGSRPLDPDNLSDDIHGYYEIYRELAGGDLTTLTQFGGGFEVALPLLFWLWGLALPPLTVNGLMFCLSATSSLLLVLWIERSFYRRGVALRPALAGLCLVMLNLYFATQLSRQFLALIVLLFAFTATTRGGRGLYLALAASLHLSALPFYLVWLLARRGVWGWLAILAMAVLLRLYFLDLLAAFDVIPAALADKLLYYVDNEDSATDADIGSLRMIFLLAALSLLSLLASRMRPDARTRPWLALPWLTGVIHYVLLSIPLASLRSTLIVHSVLPGLIAWQMFAHRAHALRPVVLGVLLLYKAVGYAAANNGANLRPSVAMLAGFFA
jgi:EpsG family